MARAKKSIARSDRYTYGKKVPSEKTKSGFRTDKSQPRDENDPIFCKKGDTYWTWKFLKGGTHYSLRQPRPSQLTQSEFHSTILSIQETIDDMEVSHFPDMDSMESFRQDIEDQIGYLLESLEEKESNLSGSSMEHLPVYELITERMEAVDQWQQDVNSVIVPEMDEESIRTEVEEEMEDDRDEYEEGEWEVDVEEEVQNRKIALIEEFIEELQQCTCETE